MKILMVNDIADCGESYFRPFEHLGERMDIDTSTSVTDIDFQSIGLIVFCGGSDVDPSMYEQTVSPKCGFIDVLRDRYEDKIYSLASYDNIPMVGICRGAQFLCVMNGGTLVQHIVGHNQDHVIHVDDPNPSDLSEVKIVVNSLHHQMMLPPKTAKMIAWTTCLKSNVYYGGLDRGEKQTYYDPVREVEAVLFNKRCLGVQWHPEIMDEDSQGYKVFVKMVENLLRDVED